MEESAPEFTDETPTPVSRPEATPVYSADRAVEELRVTGEAAIKQFAEAHGYVLPTTMRIINRSGFPLEYKTRDSIGLDLHAVTGRDVIMIGAGRRWLVDTGISIELPEGFGAFVQPRSGLARDHGLVAVTGTIDRDYRGTIKVTLVNHGNEDYKILPGDRIAQLVLVRVDQVHIIEVDGLTPTERAGNGFGSTGR